MKLLMNLRVEGNASEAYLCSDEFGDACYEFECKVEKLANEIFDNDEISGIEVTGL